MHTVRLIALIAAVAYIQAPVIHAQADPGPVWAGINDTATFSTRMEQHLTAARAALDSLRAVPGRRTLANTVRPYLRADFELDQASARAGFAQNIHPDAAFREHARKWADRLTEHRAALGGDVALYQALAAVNLSDTDSALRYVIGRELERYRRNGIDRSPDVRARVAALRAQISAVGSRFEQNIFSDRDTLRLQADALAGVPAGLLAAYPPDTSGIHAIEVTMVNALPLLTMADRRSTREAVLHAYLLAGHPANLPLVDSLRALRHELATLLGYPSWAAYNTELNMAGTPQTVHRFLRDVSSAAGEVASRELARLVERRRLEEPDAADIDAASLLYWMSDLQKDEFALDDRQVQPYLSYSDVRDGVLATFARVFELQFRSAPTTPVWSDDAEAYEVWEQGALVGRFYLDMHPRDGKLTACGVSTQRMGGGAVPEVVLMCNLSAGRPGDSGLLRADELRLFFHEFGHVVHFLFQGRSEVQGSVETDFLEAPSQLFEAWATDPRVLRSFARHHETGEPMPEDLIVRLGRANEFGRALIVQGFQLWQAVLALELHEAPPVEDPTSAVEARVAAAGVFPTPEGISAGMFHLSPYSSTVYTYLWSSVIAQDLLTGFNRADLLDPAAGRRYRDMVLAPAGTAPAAVLVERFLGRPFNTDAWRAWLEGGG